MNFHNHDYTTKGGPKINWKNDVITKTWGRFNRAGAKDYENQLNKAKKCRKVCEDENKGKFGVNLLSYFTSHCKC